MLRINFAILFQFCSLTARNDFRQCMKTLSNQCVQAVEAVDNLLASRFNDCAVPCKIKIPFNDFNLFPSHLSPDESHPSA